MTGTIDLTGPQRPWPAALSARFAEQLSEALRSPDCWRTPPPLGEPRLLERLGELFGAPEGRTLVTGGVRSFAAAWAGRTATSVVERPSFSDVPAILGSVGAVRRPSWEELPRAVPPSAPPTTVWVTSPCRNPDGRSLGPQEAAVLRALAAAGHHVVVNQVYRWFAPPGPAVEGGWTVTSLAKLCGGGSRLGWATLPTGRADVTLLRACGPATAWQRAWAGFLRPRVVRDLLTACVEPTLEAREAFAHRTAELLGWAFPGQGMSLVLEEAGAAKPGRTPVDRLAGLGLAVSPGPAFGLPAHSVRLAFSGVTAEQARRAAELLARPAGAGEPGLRAAGCAIPSSTPSQAKSIG